MNVRYVLTDAEDLGVSGLNRVVGPVQNAFGTTVYLFQPSENYPAAFVAPAIVKATDEEMLGTVLDPRFDVTRAALFDTAVNGEGRAAHVTAGTFAGEGANDSLRSRRDRRRAGPARRSTAMH